MWPPHGTDKRRVCSKRLGREMFPSLIGVIEDRMYQHPNLVVSLLLNMNHNVLCMLYPNGANIVPLPTLRTKVLVGWGGGHVHTQQLLGIT